MSEFNCDNWNENEDDETDSKNKYGQEYTLYVGLILIMFVPLYLVLLYIKLI